MYTFTAGETIWFGLENTDNIAVQSVDAFLFKSSAKLATAPDGPSIATFEKEAKSPLAEGYADGWMFTISAEDSEALQPGVYYAQPVLNFANGFVDKPAKILITIEA